MNIFGICLVKNEADIIKETLVSASRWCDKIFVYDNGSDDNTWEIVNSMAKDITTIVPFLSRNKPFSEALRSEVFNHYRNQSEDGDWWCRLDADEIYIDNPRKFLETQCHNCHVVWAIHLQYYFTDIDLMNIENDRNYLNQNIANRLKYYIANASEPRFFKYRQRLQWEYGAWPRHLGLVCPQRLRIRHYQYRSPQQIQKRIETRKQARNMGFEGFAHADYDNWKKLIHPSGNLNKDTGDNKYIIDEQILPKHLEKKYIRVIKKIMHGLKIWP